MGKKLLILLFILITGIFNYVNAEEILKINSINFDNSDNLIFITATNSVENIDIKSMKLSNPDRISFDINNSILVHPAKSWSFKHSAIKQLRISQFTTDPNIVRMVITYNDKFNINKLKLYKSNNSIIIAYNENTIKQDYFSSAYNDEKALENYYEYTTFEEEKQKNSQVTVQKQTSQEVLLIQQAFGQNSEYLKRSYPKLNTASERQIKLKSKFYANRIDIKKGNALIRGIGEIAIEKPFVITNPNRLVFDLPNTYVAPEIRNKEYILSENETIKIGQNEPTKARIVVTSNDVNKYRPVYSYDRQSIFLAHDDRTTGLKLYDKKTAIYTYSAKKINDNTDILQFVFTEPIIHSINKLDETVEINLYNVSGFDHNAYKQNLTSEVLSKLRTESLGETGIRVIIPIKKNTKINYEEGFDNKHLKLTLKTIKETELYQQKPTPSILKRNQNIKTVVIDAGHGGSDVGATREGIYEKDLTLDISKRLATILRKKGINVLMVRNNDTTVSLEERVDFSENNKADVFVSIHVNSSVTPEGNGLETHYYTPQSYDFAQIVHKEFTSAIKAKDRGLFKSKFYVINHTTCPSILIETGFISNPEEREELLTTQRKQKTAESIAKGILKYLCKD